MTLGEMIRKKRTEKHLTQRKLGAIMNTTNIEICNIENDKAKPNLKTLYKLAQALEIDYATLFELRNK